MIKYKNSQATNTVTIAPRISHVIPVEVLLYACSRPPVEVMRSAFFDSRLDAFSINYHQRDGEAGKTFESSLSASPKAILRSFRPRAIPSIDSESSSCVIR